MNGAMEQSARRGVGWWLPLAAALVCLLDLALSALLMAGQASGLAELVGMAVGRALVAPAIVVALSQMLPRFRNARSRIHVFLWTSLLLALLALGSLSGGGGQ